MTNINHGEAITELIARFFNMVVDIHRDIKGVVAFESQSDQIGILDQIDIRRG